MPYAAAVVVASHSRIGLYLEAFESAVDLFGALDELVPVDPFAGIGGGSTEDGYEVAADTRRHSRIIELALDDILVERYDVVDSAFLINLRRLAAALEFFAADEHLSAVLGFERSLCAEHAVPDSTRTAVALVLFRHESNTDVIGIDKR